MAKGHLDEIQKAEIVSKSNFVPSAFIKNITELITSNKFYFRGGRYRQVSLYILIIDIFGNFLSMASSENHMASLIIS